MSLVHRKVTPAVTAANRANSQKSTGPSTDEGKLISRCNALKHWGQAESIRLLFPALGEDPAEFEQVRDGLYEALHPQDAFETVLVGDMVEIHWRLRRIIRAEAAAQAKRRCEEQAMREEVEAKNEAGRMHDLERLGLHRLDRGIRGGGNRDDGGGRLASTAEAEIDQKFLNRGYRSLNVF